ncbi:PD-(D/E)XK nuclease family protein [Ralstonia solanacearum]|uniref:PD-(D/E)XK nuclease family protein n=1 Tax=Ralstonia solanacearum TaxID=305 RepID=UPI0005ABE393|nr:PD-(D/E)XK nuclease family protein [Ralstonia solanacearum]MDC6177450.1 PD-(D/E)XK nuclease family protein [Ralstonia solanacearum]MDC6208941.1 PD-(D/E)XK nuclease family protein [Ralstonia solanacearum]MDC6241549.1 PD-(D/E)XK nuclease family protein [Ralstonia solanacearum]MDD7799141.1 PD-(D/E)XK nuclease family protein [Ralstonia solanacearum]
MQTLAFAPGPAFLPHAADAAWRFFDAHAAQAPGAGVVVVPTAAQIPGVRGALHASAQAGGVPRLLPRILTLGHWLLDLPPEPGLPAARSPLSRLLAVQQALKTQAWLREALGAQDDAALWGVAQVLVTVSDELSQRWLTLDAADSETDGRHDVLEAALSAALEHTYAQLSERFLGTESRIVLTFWRLLSGASDPIPVRLRAMRRLLDALRGPMVWMSPTDPEGADLDFLTRAAGRVPVLRIGYDWQACEPAPEAAAPATHAAFRNLLLHAWSECGTAAQPAAEASAEADRPPPGLRIAGAARFEDEAAFAAHTLVDWLNAGRRSLALVAQDRIVARRVRALLARVNVPVRDETGWKLSTTRAAAALMRWLDVVQGDGDTAALLDLLKSPFCLREADAPSSVAPAWVAELERRVRRRNVSGGWGRLRRLAAQRGTDTDAADVTDAGPLAERLGLLADEAALWRRAGHATLEAWVTLLAGTLDRLRMRTGLQNDDAGRQLLDWLDRLRVSVHGSADAGARFSLQEWRALLSMLLESAVFSEPAPPADRRVVILPLNGARMRRFDGVVVVGCDDAQLPSAQPEWLFFSNDVRRELGLPDRAQRFAQQARDLAEVLLNQPEVVLTWQRHGGRGEPNRLSGWLERLQRRLAVAGMRIDAPVVLPALQTASRPTDMPAPAAPALVPATLSAAAYNSLRRCPYQFFVGRMLRLGELGEVSDELEKRDVGELLHAILHRFHRQLLDTPMADPADRLALLQSLTDERFGSLLAEDGHALRFYRRWQDVMPSYLDWQAAREAEGWRFEAGEVDVDTSIALPGGQALRLRGRIDRIDTHPEHGVAVLDYKTQSPIALARKAKTPFEDCQLPFYGLLDARAAVGGWVSLDGDARGDKRETGLPDFTEVVDWLTEQMGKDMTALAAGAPLPAFGDESACRYCAARGLCRKGYWSAGAAREPQPETEGQP